MIRSEIIRLLLRVTHKLIPKLKVYFKYEGLNLIIPHTIFNPTFTLSTTLILSNVKPHGNVLDLGCGSGVIAIYIAKHFKDVVKVYAYDVSPLAIATTKINAKLNNVEDRVCILTNLKGLKVMMDYVILNPPYLPIEPKDVLDLNWCAGRDLRILFNMIRSSLKLLRTGGKVFLTISSVTNPTYVINKLRFMNITTKVITCIPTPLDKVCLIAGIKLGSNNIT